MFDNIIGNQRIKSTLARMLREGRIPGSMLFTGEDGIGKRLFALDLARALNCHAKIGLDPCGECARCRRISKIVFPPKDDKDANEPILWSQFPDVGVIRPSGKFIRVTQMREVEREANFRPYEGDARVFIVEEADRLNEASSNALLKTLEEPAPTTHLILITARPAQLLSTIRSRCQIIRFSPLTSEEISGHLTDVQGFQKKDAVLLARLSGGSLGRALETDLESYKEQRAAMLEILMALAVDRDRVKLLRGSEQLNDAKLKDEYEPRLDLLTGLIHDVWLMQLGADGGQVVNEDLMQDLGKAAANRNPKIVADWLRQIEKHKRGFQVNVNKKVATDALLLEMADA
jgi:DNA polymerase-3 subunit delta'